MCSSDLLASSSRQIAWVNTGFFAGGQPDVDTLLEQAAQATQDCGHQLGKACDTVLIQPHLLFEGELMDQLRSKLLRCRQLYPDRNWILARPLGSDPGLASVFAKFILNRIGP